MQHRACVCSDEADSGLSTVVGLTVPANRKRSSLPISKLSAWAKYFRLCRVTEVAAIGMRQCCTLETGKGDALRPVRGRHARRRHDRSKQCPHFRRSRIGWTCLSRSSAKAPRFLSAWREWSTPESIGRRHPGVTFEDPEGFNVTGYSPQKFTIQLSFGTRPNSIVSGGR
jgi:hypothetical protein